MATVAGAVLLGHPRDVRPGDFIPMVYTPRGACREVITCRDPSILIEGPAGTGKSRAAMTKLHLCLLKYPGARALLLRKQRTDLSEVLENFERDVLCGRRVDTSNATTKHRHAYRYPNGSKLVCGGCEDPEDYKSHEYDLIMCEEATQFEERDIGILAARLDRHPMMPYNQIILSTNPDEEHHWLNVAASAGKFRRLLSRHEDNPSVTEKYLERLRQLEPVERARLYEGKWVGRRKGDMVFSGEIIGWLREESRRMNVVRGGSTVGALVPVEVDEEPGPWFAPPPDSADT